MSVDSHCWDYTGNLSSMQLMKSIGTPSSNELQWLDLEIGHQDDSSGNDCDHNMPHSLYIANIYITKQW